MANSVSDTCTEVAAVRVAVVVVAATKAAIDSTTASAITATVPKIRGRVAMSLRVGAGSGAGIS